MVNWENRGFEIFNNAKKDRRNVQNYPDEYKFSPIVTWSLITSGKPTFDLKIIAYLILVACLYMMVKIVRYII